MTQRVAVWALVSSLALSPDIIHFPQGKHTPTKTRAEIVSRDVTLKVQNMAGGWSETL